MSEPTAKDLLKKKQLPAHKAVGDELVERVGARAWDRPNVAVSDRLYRRYHVQDPWDPQSPKEGDPIGLGPVSLRLGETKREVAPHAKPPDVGGGTVKKADGSAAAVDPLAKWRRPAVAPTGAEAKAPPTPPKPAPTPTTPPKPAEAGKPPAPGEAPKAAAPAGKPAPPLPTPVARAPGERKLTPGLFDAPKKEGGKEVSKSDRPPLRGPLPQRPGSAAAPTGGGGVAPARPAAPPARPGAPAASGSRPAAPPRPIARPGRGVPVNFDDEPEVTEVVDLPPPSRPAAPSIFDLGPAPEIVDLSPAPAPPPPPAPVVEKPVEKPVDRRIPTGPAGLDDIFGMASEGGRLKRHPKPEGEKPRRNAPPPPVVKPESS